MKIVVLSPSGRNISASVRTLPPDAQISVVTSAAVAHDEFEIVRLAPPSAPLRAVDAWLLRTPVGRAMRRLSPVDPGSVFERSTRSSSAAAAALVGADLIVAAERDAVYAAWRWARRTSAQAVVGFPAARMASRANRAAEAP